MQRPGYPVHVGMGLVEMRWTLIDYSNLTGNKKILVYSALIIIVGAQFAFLLYQMQSYDKKTAPFSIQVNPNHIADGRVGQRSLLSVTIADQGPGVSEGEAVKITAYALGATVTVDPETIAPGEVAEVAVTPTEANAGKNLTVNILGRRGRKEKITATINGSCPLTATYHIHDVSWFVASGWGMP